MTPEEAAGILIWAAVIDTRLSPTDPEQHQIRMQQWAEQLADAPIEFAKRYVDRYYSIAENKTSIRPGYIRSAWITERTRLAQREEQPVPMEGLWKSRPDWFDAYKAACDTARAEGRDVGSVPLPYRRDQVNPRERRCANHDICACPHTDCWDGFAEVEDVSYQMFGAVYPRVVRCPACTDAIQMRDELAPPKRRGARR